MPTPSGNMELSPELKAAVEWLQRDVEAMRDRWIRSDGEACQILAQVIGGFPWYKDDQKNFPGATEKDGVCYAEHTIHTLATKVAERTAVLERELERWKSWQATNTLAAERDTALAELATLRTRMEGLVHEMPHEFTGGSGGRFTCTESDPDHEPEWCAKCKLAAAISAGERAHSKPPVVQSHDGTRCPTCDAPAPHLHPAMQYEGEVQPCKDHFHLKRTPENTPAPPVAPVRGE